jgi:predicted nucleic acid-binding protein
MSPPDCSPVRVVVTDTNILINLIHVGRLDLLAKLHPYSFVVPEEVVQEVKDSRQAEALRTAISSGILEVIQLADPAELTIYAELVQILGIGEAACLSLAQCRHCLIASDEKKKFRRETLARLGAGRLINTPGIFVLAISNGVLSVESADHAKAVLEQHRFTMSFSSFRDVIPG